MTRVLVTGHAGFIGFHVVRRLLSAGHQVFGVDSMSDYYDPTLKRARLNLLEEDTRFVSYEFSLEDATRLSQVFAEVAPEIVIHLAAQAGVRYSLENPSTYISSNIVGTHNLLESVRNYPIRHLMIASSSSVYGPNVKVPFAEIDGTDHPLSLYAATKKSVEIIAHSYAHLFAIPTTCFRFFTVYGPWGRPDMALFKFVDAIEGGRPIEVYGNGEMRRDFTYIDDLTAAIDLLKDVAPIRGHLAGDYDSLSPAGPFRTVNIGGGSPVGLMEFVAAVETALGTEADKHYLPMQPGDVVQTSADPRLLQSLIGEIPRTPVVEGVGRFVDWYYEYRTA